MDWNAALYRSHHGFVASLASDLLALLDARPGERVLDVGCGVGEHLAALHAAGVDAHGVDADAAMVRAARETAPEADVRVGDARALAGYQDFDAVLSNAVLHWVKPPEEAARAFARVLVPGGRLVLEMGGAGNVASVCDALTSELAALGIDAVLPWYFPRLGQVASLLEAAGFRVRGAWHFDRPTPLPAGEAGLLNWLRMFAGGVLAPLSEAERAEVQARIAARLRPHLFDGTKWTLDYVRLRVVAEKLSDRC